MCGGVWYVVVFFCYNKYFCFEVVFLGCFISLGFLYYLLLESRWEQGGEEGVLVWWVLVVLQVELGGWVLFFRVGVGVEQSGWCVILLRVVNCSQSCSWDMVWLLGVLVGGRSGFCMIVVGGGSLFLVQLYLYVGLVILGVDFFLGWLIFRK